MADLKFTYNLEIDPWANMPEEPKVGLVTRIGIIPEATESGRPVIAIAINIDGNEVVGKMTWSQFKMVYETAANAPVVVLDSM